MGGAATRIKNATTFLSPSSIKLIWIYEFLIGAYQKQQWHNNFKCPMSSPA